MACEACSVLIADMTALKAALRQLALGTGQAVKSSYAGRSVEFKPAEATEIRRLIQDAEDEMRVCGCDPSRRRGAIRPIF